MKFRILYTRKDRIVKWIPAVVMCTFSTIFLVMMDISIFGGERGELSENMIPMMIINGLILLLIAAVLGIQAVALYPYILLKDTGLVFYKPDRYSLTWANELSYGEMHVYPTVAMAKQATPNAFVTIIGSLNETNGVAIGVGRETYYLSVEDPLSFCKELSYKISCAKQ